MKKLMKLLSFNLFVLMLVASCTGTTGLGFKEENRGDITGIKGEMSKQDAGYTERCMERQGGCNDCHCPQYKRGLITNKCQSNFTVSVQYNDQSGNPLGPPRLEARTCGHYESAHRYANDYGDTGFDGLIPTLILVVAGNAGAF